MTRGLNPLSASQGKKTCPGKYWDGGGLWLHKREDGGAQWVLRVSAHGRRRETGLGALGDLSPKEARESQSAARTAVFSQNLRRADLRFDPQEGQRLGATPNRSARMALAGC